MKVTLTETIELVCYRSSYLLHSLQQWLLIPVWFRFVLVAAQSKQNFPQNTFKRETEVNAIV